MNNNLNIYIIMIIAVKIIKLIIILKTKLKYLLYESI